MRARQAGVFDQRRERPVTVHRVPDRRGGCVGFAEVELQVFDTGDGMGFRSGNLTVPFSALYGANSCSQASSAVGCCLVKPVTVRYTLISAPQRIGIWVVGGGARHEPNPGPVPSGTADLPCRPGGSGHGRDGNICHGLPPD